MESESYKMQTSMELSESCTRHVVDNQEITENVQISEIQTDEPQQTHATQLTDVSNFEHDRFERNETLNKTEMRTKRNEEFNVMKTSKHLSAAYVTKTPAVVPKIVAAPKVRAPKQRKRTEKSLCTKEVHEQTLLSWCNFAPNELKVKMTQELLASSNEHLHKTMDEMFANLSVTEKSKKKVNVRPRKRPCNTNIVVERKF